MGWSKQSWALTTGRELSLFSFPVTSTLGTGLQLTTTSAHCPVLPLPEARWDGISQFYFFISPRNQWGRQAWRLVLRKCCDWPSWSLPGAEASADSQGGHRVVGQPSQKVMQGPQSWAVCGRLRLRPRPCPRFSPCPSSEEERGSRSALDSLGFFPPYHSPILVLFPSFMGSQAWTRARLGCHTAVSALLSEPSRPGLLGMEIPCVVGSHPSGWVYLLYLVLFQPHGPLAQASTLSPSWGTQSNPILLFHSEHSWK